MIKLLVVFVFLVAGGLVLNGLYFAAHNPGKSKFFDDLLIYLGLKDDET